MLSSLSLLRLNLHSPMSSISSSDHRLPMTKRQFKPLILRDYLLDDLSSCSSNGFKSFPRRQSSTVRLLLDADMKRSGGIFHHKQRLTCGLAFSHAVQKASTALLTAVKLLPLPTSVNSSRERVNNNKKAVFSRSFSTRLLSRSFWKKPSRRELNVDGEIERKTEGREQEIKRWRTFGDFLKESQDQPSDQISYISPTGLFPVEAALSNAAGGNEFYTNSEVTQSSETSTKNDAVEDVTGTTDGAVMMSGDCVGTHVSYGSSVNDNREDCVNEEKEQLSPISILECPFQDDAITSPHSHQKEIDEKKLLRRRRKFESLVQLEPVDLKKRIEKYEEIQDHGSHVTEIEEDESENRANRLFALVISRIIKEPNHLLASHIVDNLLLDFFKEDKSNETRDEDKLVEIVEEWVMGRQEEEHMFMSWEVREKREIYVKEMKWGSINGDERGYVVEELGNGFVTLLIDELILDLLL
ncbi:unnamed protein product [Microthlaspi erraticum]|uniref:DUF4378 domain-containing protein n=1 Tax=Microthlaspi erraticum TaxID=1685480 RepID=A0A6D2KTH1_9BRAS|nr:unnamed protein product [Microthlaspi erraticum]